MSTALINLAGWHSGARSASRAILKLRRWVEQKLSVTQTLRQTEKRLRETNDRLSMAVRAGRESFFEWNMKFGAEARISGSAEFERLLGTLGDASAMRLEAVMSLIDPEDMKKLRSIRRNCVDERRETFDVEFRFRPPGGKPRWLACHGKIDYDDANQPRRMIGVILDVTARRRADAAMRELNQELERRVEERTAALERLNAEKEALAYSVSHDLRKPLRAIHGFSQILLDDCASKFDEEGLRRLRIVLTAAEFMDKLIDDLLNLACLSHRTLHVEMVDVAALALSVFDKMDVNDPRRDVNLTIGDMPKILCDRELTRVVLEQLIENAVRFTATRGRAEIEVAGEARRGEFRFWVRDNGIGFDMSKMEKLFHPFKRMHAADGFDGTGVGLALVKRAMDLQGGRTWAEGKPDEGATFYFAFPVEEGAGAWR
jgi:PAS domain S-box-containing protein